MVTSRASADRVVVRSSGPIRDNGKFHQYRGVLLLTLAAIVIWMNVTFLVPLLMGSIFAIVLYPLMERPWAGRLTKYGKATAITFGFGMSFLLPIGTVIFLGAEAALAKITELQESMRDIGVSPMKISPSAMIDVFGLRPLIEKIADISPVSEAQMKAMSVRGLTTAGEWLVKVLQNMLATIPGAMFSTLIILITIYFLLVDGKRTLAFVRENSFFGPRQTDRIFMAVNSLCYSVVVASIAAGFVQALLIVFACLITGTHGAILIGLVSFIASFLPVFGTAPITIFLTVQAFAHGEYVSGFIFMAAIFIVGISDNIVRPYVLKGGARLHPLVGFVAAFGALDTIGFYGVFIGPVLAGLLFVILPMVTRAYVPSPQTPTTR